MRFGNSMADGCKTQYRAWSQAEALQLQELAGDMPFVMVVQQFNIWATRSGLPHRTATGIRKKLRSLGASTRACGSWIGVGDVARMLGKHRSTILAWASSGLIRHHKAGPHSTVNRDDLIKLARDAPLRFAGSDRTNLLLLLEDAELVDAILQRYPRPYCSTGRGRRVRWVDTGKVFATYQEAAEAANLHYSSISKALHEGRPAAGLRFEWAD